ncbi:ADP-ribose pyrophosphatase, mitochondrial [Amia ocellicauda]|uniref:ADP-ribose pyrophosphatase, mitochondrial n=1 Tax=Amia ocellicauda TaxID=2972642 RepID=UPI003463A933|nr:NUDT9 protein [Amia calva]
MLQLSAAGPGPIRIALTLLGIPYGLCSASKGAPSCPLVKATLSLAQSAHTGPPFVCRSGLHTMSPPSLPPHVKARCALYPGSEVKRLPVPDERVSWESSWPEYSPPTYTAPAVLKQPVWADPDIGSFSPQFNALDGAIDRQSHEGAYKLENGRPLNPRGRTGTAGRGLLGRWGPNHAADPIITRWRRDSSGEKVVSPRSGLPVLQFVSIKRKDCGEWAIPGGMVDAGELVSLTLQREFSEEALNSLDTPPQERERLSQRITELFTNPSLQIYKGYVDDPRNTDNAWMETVAVNFHDDTGNSVSELPLQAGDDAGQVSWVDVDSALQLYASHALFLESTARQHHAHWA